MKWNGLRQLVLLRIQMSNDDNCPSTSTYNLELSVERAKLDDNFLKLLNSVPDAILVLDERSAIVLSNQNATRMFGLATDQLQARVIDDLLPVRYRSDANMHPAEFLKSLTVAEKPGRSLHGLRSDQSEFPMEVTVSPVRFGEREHTICSIRDVTLRKRGEEAIRLGQERFRLMVEGVRDYAICMLDAEGYVTEWDLGGEAILGHAYGQIQGRHLSVLFNQEAVAANIPNMELARAASEGRFEYEGWRVRADGTEIWAKITMTAMRDDSGRLRGYGKVIRDLTERKRLESSLESKNVDLERAIRAKDHFLASMSHELRTPLNAIIGFTGTMLMRLPGPLTSDQESQLRTVQSSARHLLSLINDLLDLSKIESGKVELQRERLSCQKIIDEIRPALAQLASAKRLKLDTRLQDPKMEILADNRAIKQILLNLVGNAIKFTEKGSVGVAVERRTSPQGTLVDFRVTDTGVGISEKDIGRLFQAFERVGTQTISRPEGTGLGLHLSAALAGVLDAKITVKSELGLGSVFTLTILEHQANVG